MEVDGLAWEPDLARGDKGHAEAAERPIIDVRIVRRPDQEGEVEVLGRQTLVQVGRNIDLDLQFEIRVGGVDPLDQRRQPGMDDAFGDAEANDAAYGGAVADRFDHVGPHPDQSLGMNQQLLALGCRRDQPLVAFQKARTEHLLELSDAHRHGGLRGVQPVGGAPEALEIGDPDEGLQRLEVDHCRTSSRSRLSLIRQAYRNPSKNTIGQNGALMLGWLE